LWPHFGRDVILYEQTPHTDPGNHVHHGENVLAIRKGKKEGKKLEATALPPGSRDSWSWRLLT
jgi:hypothetical protein